MSKSDQVEETDEITMTPSELHILSELDSRQYGFLLLNKSENEAKKALVIKAVKYLELMVIQATKQHVVQKENEPINYQNKKISIDPKTWVKLGHFHLLLEEYRKALSAYQMFYKTQAENHWQDAPFLYGLGLVYYHYNSFQWILNHIVNMLLEFPHLDVLPRKQLRTALNLLNERTDLF